MGEMENAVVLDRPQSTTVPGETRSDIVCPQVPNACTDDAIRDASCVWNYAARLTDWPAA